ncbi:MAG: acyltransferase [Alphaproteobacteria bacterium]|nr:MAG: acyltransferase [Alphaproteobacteria bacterium]
MQAEGKHPPGPGQQRHISRASLGEQISDRANNLNLVRMIAASAVLVSHAYPISLGPQALEPLEETTGKTLGWFAVVVFFGLSGMLIAASCERRGEWHRFWAARVLRLFPALAVVLVLTVIAGLFFTSLASLAYLTSVETWTYVPRNLSLAFLQYPLPGVFEDNPYPRAINGSLWTLFYEVTCYAGLFVIGTAGLFARRWAITLGVVVLGMAFAILANQPAPQGIIGARGYHLVMLGFPFALGALAYVWREHVRFDWRVVVVLWIGAWFALGTAIGLVILVIALLYSVGWFGFVPKGRLLNYNRLGDYSYGMYIYAFPTQQAMAKLFGPLDPMANMALAFPVALLLAALSWHLIEQRALAQIKQASAWLREFPAYCSSAIRKLAQ